MPHEVQRPLLCEGLCGEWSRAGVELVGDGSVAQRRFCRQRCCAPFIPLPRSSYVCSVCQRRLAVSVCLSARAHAEMQAPRCTSPLPPCELSHIDLSLSFSVLHLLLPFLSRFRTRADARPALCDGWCTCACARAGGVDSHFKQRKSREDDAALTALGCPCVCVSVCISEMLTGARSRSVSPPGCAHAAECASPFVPRLSTRLRLSLSRVGTALGKSVCVLVYVRTPMWWRESLDPLCAEAPLSLACEGARMGVRCCVCAVSSLPLHLPHPLRPSISVLLCEGPAALLQAVAVPRRTPSPPHIHMRAYPHRRRGVHPWKRTARPHVEETHPRVLCVTPLTDLPTCVCCGCFVFSLHGLRSSLAAAPRHHRCRSPSFCRVLPLRRWAACGEKRRTSLPARGPRGSTRSTAARAPARRRRLRAR